MATESDLLFHLIEPVVRIEAEGTPVSPEPAMHKVTALVIATRNGMRECTPGIILLCVTFD